MGAERMLKRRSMREQLKYHQKMDPLYTKALNEGADRVELLEEAVRQLVTIAQELKYLGDTLCTGAAEGLPPQSELDDAMKRARDIEAEVFGEAASA